MIYSEFPRKIANDNCTIFISEKQPSVLRLSGKVSDEPTHYQASEVSANPVFSKIPWGGAALFFFMGFSTLVIASLTSLALILG